jgi:sporulation protein YlmC with PRC-barrel domain
MKRLIPSTSVALGICVAVAASALAASPPNLGAADAAPGPGVKTSLTRPASACLKDLSVFSTKMQKDGSWLGQARDGYGYGYPMGGIRYGPAEPVGGNAAMAVSYERARPSYEIGILLTAANILAQSGQQQSCEQVLATTRTIYKQHAADLHGRGMRPGDQSRWEKSEIAAAKPVAGQNAPYGTNQLIDSDVRSASDTALGSVHDLVMNAQTGKIAYVVVARGGVLGIGEAFVPVPWGDFKATPDMNVLILDSSPSVIASAPKFDDSQLTATGDFGKRSKEVNAYWASHLSTKATD